MYSYKADTILSFTNQITEDGATRSLGFSVSRLGLKYPAEIGNERWLTNDLLSLEIPRHLPANGQWIAIPLLVRNLRACKTDMMGDVLPLKRSPDENQMLVI